MIAINSLFEPLKPAATEAIPADSVASPDAGKSHENQQTAPVSPGSGLSTQDALAGLKHTEIPAFSASAAPSVTPLGADAPGSPVSLGGLLEGKWAVDIMDSLLPAAIVAIGYAVGMKFRKSEIQLTAKEKDMLAPIMQKCMDTVLLKFDSPWSALFVTMVAIYGGKVLERGVVIAIDETQAKKQAEVLKEKIEKAEKIENPAKYDPSNQSMSDIMSGKVALPGQYPFTEEEIRMTMKEGKCNRERAIKRLKKKYGLE